ncbi:MAG: helix-turn-helix domain-containing protein, partial [Candidatus Sumerlaeia bacterium]
FPQNPRQKSTIIHRDAKLGGGRNSRNPYHGLSLFCSLIAISSPPDQETRRELSASEIVTESEMIFESMLENGFNVNELADMLGISRITLWRAFKEKTGKTPNEWILRQRIERACAFLTNNELSLKEISYCCGFKNEKYFMRCFKKITGKTPTQWRHKSD